MAGVDWGAVAKAVTPAGVTLADLFAMPPAMLAATIFAPPTVHERADWVSLVGDRNHRVAAKGMRPEWCPQLVAAFARKG